MQPMRICRTKGLLSRSSLQRFFQGVQVQPEPGTACWGRMKQRSSTGRGFPIVKEPITLTAIVSKNPLHGGFNEMPSIMQIEEKAGITLNFVQVSSSSFGEKLNLIFASGDLPDMVFTASPTI